MCIDLSIYCDHIRVRERVVSVLVLQLDNAALVHNLSSLLWMAL